jgi:signal transduction histidine kinase
MKKVRLEELKLFHEAIISEIAEDLLENISSSSSNDKEEKIWKRENVCQEVSEDLTSALLIDDLIFSDSAEPMLRTTVMASWKENGWKVQFQNSSSIKNDTFLNERNRQLQKYVSTLSTSLKDSQESLQKMQNQLLNQEKLASLGQLSAGIAHEIKNPLNFINNFSDLSTEYLEEVFEIISTSKENSLPEEAEALLKDIQCNLERIHEHSTRVERIVRSMLMHSRGKSGDKVRTDLNDLVKEYVNLAFHGMRANRNPTSTSNWSSTLHFKKSILILRILAV